MIILIAGASHTGKTILAQKLLEKYHYSYLSIDHLKMGLIRSGNTELTVSDDEALTDYLWPIVREMVKTAIENGQNLIVEGCYIPFDWKSSFESSYLENIRAFWLIMTEDYIESRFDEIRYHANVIEQRLEDGWLSKERLITENSRNLEQCIRYGCNYVLIKNTYDVIEQALKLL